MTPSWTAEEVRVAIERELSASDLPIVLLNTRAEGDKVVVEFEADERPGCRFAFRYPVYEKGDQGADDIGRTAYWNLQEELLAADRGLPDCVPGELTWVDV